MVEIVKKNLLLEKLGLSPSLMAEAFVFLILSIMPFAMLRAQK
ncbi:hypothetical protein [Virgibacillus pantothenticus]|nr:hypothetical protein [Virgibacillus pantothenticus]